MAVMFPGQGSQEVGMGTAWRDHPAWSVVTRAEGALDEPLAPLLLDEQAGLTRTRDVQLAVLLTSLVVWEAAREALPAPVAFAGHSFGQVTALIAAGALSLEDGVRLAARRAELTQAAADRHEGRMAALMGVDGDQVSEVCAAAPGECWLANDNAPGQIVIAGTVSGMERAAKAATEAGVRRVIPLNVGGAFHTPLMQEAADGMAGVLADVSFAAPSAPVVSNADAVPYTDGEGWRLRLAEHLVSPVRWRPSMTTLVSELSANSLIEVGHGSTLSGLAKRCVPGTPVSTIGSPTDVPPTPEVG